MGEALEALRPKSRGWKYTVGEEEDRRELFDLVQEAGELRNRADTASDRAELLAGWLEAWRRARVVDLALPSSRPQDRKALEVLGYLE